MNKYLFKRYFITASKAMSEELEVLELPLSSTFKDKIKLRKKEHKPAFAGIESGPVAQESLGYLPEPSAS